MTIDIHSFGPERFSSRELSRLEFGARLLDLAEDHILPILERCKFIAIFADMIDEFFQVRVVSLEDKVAAGVQTPSLDGVRPRQQLAAIRERVTALVERQDRLMLDVLLPELADSGIAVTPYEKLSVDEQEALTTYFDANVYPVLTPLAVDPGHPFPMISNLSLNIAVTVRDETSGEERSARVKVPNSLPRFLPAGPNKWCPLEDLIMANLGRLFTGMTIGRADLFRVTRNADLTLEEDEADDLLVALEVELRRRRFGEALRVEIQSGMSSDFLNLLVEQLEIERSNVYVTDSLLGLHDLWSLYAIDRPDLKGEGWSPVTPKRLLDGDHVGDIFAAIRDEDILLHHPYESFSDSVEMFIAQAADDPKVVGIKQTLYRTSGDSPIVASLIQAAERDGREDVGQAVGDEQVDRRDHAAEGPQEDPQARGVEQPVERGEREGPPEGPSIVHQQGDPVGHLGDQGGHLVGIDHGEVARDGVDPVGGGALAPRDQEDRPEEGHQQEDPGQGREAVGRVEAA